jgi:hypothetical protein
LAFFAICELEGHPVGSFRFFFQLSMWDFSITGTGTGSGFAFIVTFPFPSVVDPDP